MSELSNDTIRLLLFLLPGFLAAWVFYGLTSHKKPDKFERVVQALIFTLLVQAVVTLEKWGWGVAQKSVAVVGPWSPSTDIVAASLTALALGVLFAWLSNRDSLHSWMRDRGLTTRTSHPSDWHGVFSENREHFVVLHMSDERRLFGWPETWPSESADGYFYIQQASWEGPGDSVPLTGVDGVLVNAKDVKWVEFVGRPTSKPDELAPSPGVLMPEGRKTQGG